MVSNASNFVDWLAENPKMMGVFWALVLIFSETSVVASGGNAIYGP
ncbi:DUF7503 family protein [Halorussus halophilus]